MTKGKSQFERIRRIVDENKIVKQGKIFYIQALATSSVFASDRVKLGEVTNFPSVSCCSLTTCERQPLIRDLPLNYFYSRMRDGAKGAHSLVGFVTLLTADVFEAIL